MTRLKSTASPLATARRKPISATALVEERRLCEGGPWLATATTSAVDLRSWATAHRDALETRVLQNGAILFRGFAVSGTEQFEEVIKALSPGALEYTFRASPRTRVGGNIYTSTDYPADQPIFPHNEHSYSPRFPLRLFFHCAEPAAEGGETPIGSTRAVTARIPAAIRESFAARGVRYVRNYGDGFGLPWRTVFQTDDRAEVERYCASVGIEVEWKGSERLRTEQVGPALLRHPRTGEMVWFNHATFFHVSTLPASIGEPLRRNFGSRDLPTQTFYGDGGEIEPGVLETLREAYRGCLIKFPWQRGDVLFLDNMLCVHGREPFRGARSILTGMAEAQLGRELAGGAK